MQSDRRVKLQVKQEEPLVEGVKDPLQFWQMLTSEQVRQLLMLHSKQELSEELRLKLVSHCPQVVLSISQKAQLVMLQVNPHSLLSSRVKLVAHF